MCQKNSFPQTGTRMAGVEYTSVTLHGGKKNVTFSVFEKFFLFIP